jgi:hypothetical protein
MNLIIVDRIDSCQSAIYKSSDLKYEKKRIVIAEFSFSIQKDGP